MSLIKINFKNPTFLIETDPSRFIIQSVTKLSVRTFTKSIRTVTFDLLPINYGPYVTYILSGACTGPVYTFYGFIVCMDYESLPQLLFMSTVFTKLPIRMPETRANDSIHQTHTKFMSAFISNIL